MSSDSQLFFYHRDAISQVMKLFPKGFTLRDALEQVSEYDLKVHGALVSRGILTKKGVVVRSYKKRVAIWKANSDLEGWYRNNYVSFTARSNLAKENKAKALNNHTTNEDV